MKSMHTFLVVSDNHGSVEALVGGANGVQGFMRVSL